MVRDRLRRRYLRCHHSTPEDRPRSIQWVAKQGLARPVRKAGPSRAIRAAVPLAPGYSRKVEVVLESLHRSGRAASMPGAVLSQGNLNTAALTLFLGLYLSVPAQLPWLVLDDPLQSMDDVHIAQIAALLRTCPRASASR
jgi:ATPase subunit of ABC transporter with duplicated ATPase domains